MLNISLTTRPFQLVVYIVWPGEHDSAVQNDKILQTKDEKSVVYKMFAKILISLIDLFFGGDPFAGMASEVSSLEDGSGLVRKVRKGLSFL